MRPPWETLPRKVQGGVENVLGFAVRRAVSVQSGFSPGVAAVVEGSEGQRAFVKAASPATNPVTPQMHRDEATALALLPDGHPSPRLLGLYEDGDWVAIAVEHLEGRRPGLPWTDADLSACFAVLDRQADVVAPPELLPLSQTNASDFKGWRGFAADPPADLTPNQRRHLIDLAQLEARWSDAAVGDRWLHGDVRGDNLLVRPDGMAVLIDWPASSSGNPLTDAVFFVPSTVHDLAPSDVAGTCEQLLQRSAAGSVARPALTL
jgi:aminoglycoside phosphotransferase (APT) family kinase protein